MRSAAALLAASAAATLFALPALAADIVKPAAPKAVVPVVAAPAPYDWHACYFGGLAGYGWGDSTWTDTYAGQFSHDHPAGPIAGGQIGCDTVHGNLVLGVESQLFWSNLTDSQHHVTGDPDDWVDKTWIKADLTITGRVGIAHDRTLWYVKGGATGADVTYTDTGFNPSGDYKYSFSHKRWGYLIGGGVEVALHGRWSLRAEYDYMNLGSQPIVLHALDAKPGQPTETFTSGLTISTALVELNYRFR